MDFFCKLERGLSFGLMLSGTKMIFLQLETQDLGENEPQKSANVMRGLWVIISCGIGIGSEPVSSKCKEDQLTSCFCQFRTIFNITKTHLVWVQSSDVLSMWTQPCMCTHKQALEHTCVCPNSTFLFLQEHYMLFSFQTNKFGQLWSFLSGHWLVNCHRCCSAYLRELPLLVLGHFHEGELPPRGVMACEQTMLGVHH